MVNPSEISVPWATISMTEKKTNFIQISFAGCATLHKTTNRKYPQLGILSPIGDIKTPVGDNIYNWGYGIFESGKAESDNKSQILNCIK